MKIVAKVVALKNIAPAAKDRAQKSKNVPKSITVFLPSLITTEKEKIDPSTVNPKKA